MDRRRVCKHSLGATIYFPMLSQYLFINAGCVCKHWTQNEMFMLMLTLILLLILVDGKMHGTINISLDANLGARSFLFATNILRMGTVMLTLAGMQAFPQVWVLLVRKLYT